MLYRIIKVDNTIDNKFVKTIVRFTKFYNVYCLLELVEDNEIDMSRIVFLYKLPTLVRETSRTDVLDSAQDLSILT